MRGLRQLSTRRQRVPPTVCLFDAASSVRVAALASLLLAQPTPPANWRPESVRPRNCTKLCLCAVVRSERALRRLQKVAARAAALPAVRLCLVAGGSWVAAQQ